MRKHTTSERLQSCVKSSLLVFPSRLFPAAPPAPPNGVRQAQSPLAGKSVWGGSRQANGAILMPESRAFPVNNDCARREFTMTTGGSDFVGPGPLEAAMGCMPTSWDLGGEGVA